MYETTEPFSPKITPLGNTDTICLPALPAGWYYYIDGIVISNLANVARTFDLFLRPTATPASAANQICNDVSINANTFYQHPIGPLTVPAGYVISGAASSVGSVNIILTGFIKPLPPVDPGTLRTLSYPP